MSYEEIKKFIKDNNIRNKREFSMKKYKEVYEEYLKLSSNDRDSLLPTLEANILPKSRDEIHRFYEDKFSTVSDFQLFINENNILNPVDFRGNYPKLYDRFCRIIPSNEKQKLIYKVRKRSYSDIDSIEKLQSFIDGNHVSSRKELHKSFSGLYVKFQSQLDSVMFNNVDNSSMGENYLKKLFNENSIKFITQKTYSGLRNILPLRYDFYLPDYNVLVEHHGEGHFGKGRYYTAELIENDKKKYNYAIANNIKILYYTIYKSEYFNNGYFTEVITDSDILLQKLKEISLTN
jgi:hypothetical protein